MQMIKTTSLKKEQKELLIFLTVTYGLTFLMGIPMAILFHAGKDLSFYAAVQMLYPAAGLILAKLTGERENALLPKRFFVGLLTLTGLMVLLCFTVFFLPEDITSSEKRNLLMVGTFIVGILYFSEKKEKRSAYGLTGKNWGQCFRLLGVFLALFLARLFLSTVATEGPAVLRNSFSSVDLPNLLTILFIAIPFDFVSSFLILFGEEYGWRCYFQPLLQEKFGLIKGVFLFGVLWGFWHLPLAVFYYTPARPGTSLAQFVVSQCVHCIIMAIFMAYAYMKTHNVWLPVLVHFTNNAIISVLNSRNGSEETTWMIVVIDILVQMALFLPFLSSRVFQQPQAICKTKE